MYNANQEENKILDFWRENKSFEKSLEKNSKEKEYSFYDGPPFATGLPHYGHIVASLMKDIVPRYWTMQGYRVDRRWGWDCHGLPIENIVEQELNLKSRKDLEDYGLDKFCSSCRSSVLTYANDWKKTIEKIGRWVDMENDYKTMDLSFMESVWWVFGELWKKDLIYKGHKPMHICPRCETPLSNFEVTQEYKEVTDVSAIAKFYLKDIKNNEWPEDTAILSWTTTPWTLPGNVLLAVNEDINYALVYLKEENQNFILAKDLVETILKDKKYEIKSVFSGDKLLGLSYEPLFPYFKNTEKAFRVVNGEFVTVFDGTGVVHIAPAFGEDDFKIGEQEGISLVQHVKMNGQFTDEVIDFQGLEVKPKGDPKSTDKKIIEWLEQNNKLFSQEPIKHAYPHCWRCDTPLLNYATASWFVKVTQIKNELLENNQMINWVPEHIKDGRFGQWLEGARDWAISRNRYWGTPLPIWENEDGETICLSSVKELEELSGEKITDIHKNIIDKIILSKDGKKYHRIPEVLDCWFESGSMPYAQMHYPFENKEKFERNFPAQFIAEGQDQTRGWFYTLHILATALTSGENPSIPINKSQPAFKNCVVNGIVLAEDGKKMSKKLKNYPDPQTVIEKFGADALRYYLCTSPVMMAENINFSESSVKEVYNKLINTLDNVFSFYQMYEEEKIDEIVSENILDQWILAKLKILIKEVTENMNAYQLINASRPIGEFVTELSQWYLRRSRDRFKNNDLSAKATLKYVLLTLSKVMAPFTPFIAERIFIYFNKKEKSVHLEDWPEIQKLTSQEEKILLDMNLSRKIVENGLAIRAEKSLKVRQPLSTLVINKDLSADLKEIIADELNIKEISTNDLKDKQENWIEKSDGDLKIILNIELTEELKNEGLTRELIRTINQMRKEMSLTVKDEIELIYQTSEELLEQIINNNETKIKEAVLASKISKELQEEMVNKTIENKEILIKIIKKN